MEFDFDFVIVGSGFGGSVSAMRLSEKGYSVAVLERGKRFRQQDFARTNWDLRRYLWMPALKCFGIQNMSLFKHVLVLSGTGVGGGSLVYANTLLQPSDEFFNAPVWKDLADWKSELLPHYQTAKRMLGVTANPSLSFVDEVVRSVAQDMGRGDTFKPTDIAVYFGEPGKTVPDPYFGGTGPQRTGCTLCGGCMVGCRYNSKNTLDKNYLYFAEKNGAQVFAERNVVDLGPIEGGWEIETERSTAWFLKERKTFRARNVILSAGALGTVSLLLKCKERSLSRLSSRLGSEVRTNSEALVGVAEVGAAKERDYSRGPAISSIFHADEVTHIEPVRYSKGSSFMRLLAVPMVGEGGPLLRLIKLLLTIVTQPLKMVSLLFHRRWSETTIILLVMQNVDNKMNFVLGRGLFTFFRKRMTTAKDPQAKDVPTYIPVANQVARAFADKVGGIPMSAVNEVALNIPTTAHILGGAPIGADISSGVIDKDHRVFGYEGLFVCDGSAIPANLGVNPSLTITAMTERAMSKIPAKKT